MKSFHHGKHTTARDCVSHGAAVGCDLFDDEHPGQVSIYLRFADGTLWPARTVDPNAPHGPEVLSAWQNRGETQDHRGGNGQR